MKESNRRAGRPADGFPKTPGPAGRKSAAPSAETEKALSGGHEVKRLLLLHGAVLLGIGLYLLLSVRCPLLRLTGVPCPLCGMTRAHLAALHLDFAAAFWYHPLFFLAVPGALYVSHRRLWFGAVWRPWEKGLGALIAAAFLAVWVIRAFFLPDSPVYRDWEASLLYQWLGG